MRSSSALETAKRTVRTILHGQVFGEGGKWDDMCENIRERILNVPDHESEVGINALRHCEQGRRHHNQDCEFKYWHHSFRELWENTLVLFTIVAKSYPRPGVVPQREFCR